MNYDVLLVHAAVFIVGTLASYLIFLMVYRKSQKSASERELKEELRQAELSRKANFYESKANKFEELYNALSLEYDSLKKAHEKSVEENKALVSKIIESEVKNMDFEEHIHYLEALLHKSRINFIGRYTSERLLGDESNEY